jgi:hypothetical protein
MVDSVDTVNKRLQNCEEFIQWCHKVGIKFPKLEFPAIFEGGLWGVRVTEDIQHNEAFVAVPYSAIMSCEKAFADPQLGPILKKHPELFDMKLDTAEHKIMLVYLFFEWQKGEESFWYPWFKVYPVDDQTLFWNWKENEVKALQDPYLINEFKEYQGSYVESLQSVYTMMKKYPDVFKREFVTWDLLERLEACVDTRVFGSSRLKSCSMIPFCDAINHSCVRNSNQSVNKTLHLDGSGAKGSYFTPKKFTIDYSILFDDIGRLEPQQIENVTGLFDREKYESHQSFDWGAFTEENPDKGIWEVPWVVERWN